MTAIKVTDVAEVERLALNPGDMIVLKFPTCLSDDEFAELQERWRDVFPGQKVKVLVLDGGADIAVIKAEQTP